MGRGYISNGCVRCGRRQGQHYEIHARYDEQVACSFPLQISEEWRSVIQAQYDGTEWWSVYPPGVLVE
jgi:competence protein CoiA